MAIPPIIGRLHVERQLGAGGFATVWSARDPDLDALVAVKVLAENWAGQEEVRQRFLDEARLLRRVDSDQLVRVYDVGQLADGRPYFVMTYADGGSLADRLAVQPAPWPDAVIVDVVDAVAAGLTVLHTHGVVHRDVKPRNILLRSTRAGGEQILIGDLGIAKDLDWASGLTMPAGSGSYMAPEQKVFSDRIGPATDVYALAMTVAELAQLTMPWPATPIGEVLDRATHPDPDRRTPTPAELARQLRGCLTRDVLAEAGAGVPEVATASMAPRPDAAWPEPASSDPASSDPASSDAASTAVATPVGHTLAGGPAPLALAGSSAAGRGHRRTAALVGVGLLAVGLAAGWWMLGRPAPPASGVATRVLTPESPHVSVQVPVSWRGQAAVAFPGESFTDEGTRAGDGTRSVAVALNGFFMEPATVLPKIVVSGCGTPTQRSIAVGPYRGLGYHYARCADGTVVDEVALADNGASEWSVWVEVRSVNGDPDLATVLRSLRITP